MKLFDGNNIFLVLSENSLSVFLKQNPPAPLIFTDSVLKYQEIRDKKMFEKIVKEYLTHFRKREAILFLSDTITYQKKITRSPNINFDEELNNFLDTIPFSKEVIEKKVIPTSTEALLFATNADLYKTIVAIAQQVGIKVTRVLPLPLFAKEIQGQQLSFDMLSHLAGEKGLVGEGDFLGAGDEKEKEHVPFRQIIMLAISLCLFAGSLVLLLVNLGIISYRAEQKIVSPIPKQTITPSSVPSPSLPVSDDAQLKDRLPIELRTISSDSTLTASITSQLHKAGFNTIIFSTNTASDSGNTMIFTATVSASIRDQLITALKPALSDLATNESSLSSEFPVAITIGKSSQ